MRVLVSGSTGLIGNALIGALQRQGHQPVRLVRSAPPDDLPSASWDPAAGHLEAGALVGIDAVIHLAGEGIAERRWSEQQKGRILDSRVEGTTLLATRIAESATPPSIFLSGSAIGFYGERGDTLLDEGSGPGGGFLAEVSQAWEAATDPARNNTTRVTNLRTGIVLSADGGALRQQLPFFKLGIGGRIGDGRQWWSWISIEDMVGALVWLLDHEISGPVNLTAPNPVTNLDFTKTLGRVLNRPTLLPIPKPALWLRLGRELTEELLYTSQRVHPAALEAAGFEFTQPELDGALRSVLDRN